MTTEELAKAVMWAADIIDAAEDDIREQGLGEALDAFRRAVRTIRSLAAHSDQQAMGIQPNRAPDPDDTQTCWECGEMPAADGSCDCVMPEREPRI